MTIEEVKKRYDSTIGRFVSAEKDNPLYGVRIDGFGGSQCANIHLCVKPCNYDREKIDKLRFAVRQYFEPALRGGEHLRCWFGVVRDPRADLHLVRKKDLFECCFDNGDVVQMVKHWCDEAGVDAS